MPFLSCAFIYLTFSTIFHLLICLFMLSETSTDPWGMTKLSFFTPKVFISLILVFIYVSLKGMKFSIKEKHSGKSPSPPSLTAGCIDLTLLQQFAELASQPDGTWWWSFGNINNNHRRPSLGSTRGECGEQWKELKLQKGCRPEQITAWVYLFTKFMNFPK